MIPIADLSDEALAERLRILAGCVEGSTLGEVMAEAADRLRPIEARAAA